jgi:Cd2+/Zn2+-exporting ATPase
VEYTGEAAGEAARKMVQDKGYSIRDDGGGRTVRFRVPQMDCSEEVSAIRKKTAGLPGVVGMEFYLVGREVRFTLKGGGTSAADLEGAIRGLGMTPILLDGGGEPADGSFSRRLLITTSASAVFIVLGFVFAGVPSFKGLSAPFYLAAVLAGGFEIFLRAIHSARNLNMDMNVLMSVAVAGAVFLNDLPEASTVVFLFAAARYLESRTMDRARMAVKELMKSAPERARVERGGQTVDVPSRDVAVGEVIVIFPGERIPLDGTVMEGESGVDQSPVTGESMPVHKGEGDGVFGGSINQEGALKVRVERIFSHSFVARIVEMVEEAQASRAPSQNFIDRFSRIYTPAVIAMAALVTLVPVLAWGADPARMFYRSMVLLLISCPCALVISTPVSVISGLTRAAKDGLLIKGGLHLENLATLDTLAIDKTGTLTVGRPQVKEVIGFNGIDSREVLRIAAGVESASTHPIAGAVLKKAREEGVPVPAGSRLGSIPGKGAGGVIDGVEYFVGRHSHLCENGICSGDAHERIISLESQGHTVAVVGKGGQVIGLISLADTIREGAAESLKGCREEGIKEIVMLTGDNPQTARAIAGSLGIDFRSELMPGGKVEFIRELTEKGRKTGMVGDGINDAPALSAATVGMAMGAAGTDAALEVADVALMADDLSRIPYALALSRKTLGVIKQNIALALGIKLVFLVMAFLGLATLWMAVFADMGASMLVILNGLRLLGFRYGGR